MHPALVRLEGQIRWYDRSATRKRRAWRGLQGLELCVAAAIPAAAGLGASAGALGVLGAVVVLLQGLRELFRSQTRYLQHRQTYEALVSERALFEAGAGPYRKQPEAEVLLAERIEEIRGSETAGWVEEETQRMRSRGQ
jgi:Protein of unknown function (DUF4231)